VQTAPGPIVEIDSVTKRYVRTVALDDISFDVAENELFALLGPNGAGKTTLIEILCTIQRGDKGSVQIAGLDVAKQSREVRKRLGVVFQEPSLDTRLTVAENLDFHGRIYGVPASVRRRRKEELLELVELAGWRDRLVRTLSKGMQRRLEIARALIHDARLLVLDEPTVGLDAQTRSRIWEYLRTLQQEREITVLVTTHYIDEVEDCDRLCIIDQGRVLALDTPQGLKNRYGYHLLRLTPQDEEVRHELRHRFGEALAERGKDLVMAAPEAEALKLIEELGDKLKAFFVERPSLESVFLSLTGYEVRDEVAGARERLLEFGRRGGEHTQ